ncbi:MAG: OmpA family protein [Cyclobacteriaceae bacterium]|nr:OmpA family protein [Cyclobacteriaceae bacterium]
MQFNKVELVSGSHSRSYIHTGRFYFIKKNLLIITLITLLNACSERPFVPVNTGREYGSPNTPKVVSHLPEANQWALARSGHHNVFQKILCFSYPCRKMIGRRKVLHSISFEKLKKKTRKNAKKGMYEKYKRVAPPDRELKPDTVLKSIDVHVDSVIVPVSIPSAPVLKQDSLITLSEFLFETNSYKLKEAQLDALDSIAQFLLRNPTLEAGVSGHTDNVGRESYNLELSTKRAEEVARYLINHGVDEDQVSFAGFGSSKPIGGNETEEGRSKNRRVEILMSNRKEE